VSNDSGLEPLEWPRSVPALKRVLEQLHDRRRADVRRWRKERGPRRPLSDTEKERILNITSRRCHICGGKIHKDDWVADHVASFATGGGSDPTNYLPAHVECNGFKWYYSPRELRWMLRMGIWARALMEGKTARGTDLRKDFWNWEKRRQLRRAKHERSH
jgi:5-methylcytosine-specific restriction endonuclease McrA